MILEELTNTIKGSTKKIVIITNIEVIKIIEDEVKKMTESVNYGVFEQDDRNTVTVFMNGVLVSILDEQHIEIYQSITDQSIKLRKK